MRARIEQAPEGLRIRAILRVTLTSIAIGALAVAIAYLMTPRPRAIRARSPGANVERSLFEARSIGAESIARSRARLEDSRVPIDEAMVRITRGDRPRGAGESAFTEAR